MSEVKRVCPQCGRMLEEKFIVCPYCGRSLRYGPERKKGKGKSIAKAVAMIILVCIVLGIAWSYLRVPKGRLELVDKDATFLDDSVTLTVTLKNSGSCDLNVEIKFKTMWDQMSDTETKFVVIPTQESRTASETLNANPNGVTEYEATWIGDIIE